jgi:nitroreductase
MEQLDFIFKRRSIRLFTNEVPDEKLLVQVLKAAMAAPSANNLRPWQFVVLRRRDLIDSIKRFHPHAGMTAQSPVVVVVCGDLSVQPHPGYLVQDCSAATQNILLAASALGLGGVWLGLYPREPRMEGIRQLLHLPENIMPVSMAALGVPAETKAPHDAYYPGWYMKICLLTNLLFSGLRVSSPVFRPL